MEAKMLDKRAEGLKQIAEDIERLTNRFVSEPITITFEQMTDEMMEELSAWVRGKFRLIIRGDEYFLIRQGKTLLYVVNVTADSMLTAARELMDMIGRKF